MKSQIKFFIKWTLVGWTTRTVFSFFGAHTNTTDWEKRILVVNLHGIGDVILATPALRAYRDQFAGKEIYMVVAKQSGMTKEMFSGYVDVLIKVDVRKFGFNPLYAVRTINQLRAIGFAEVINECLGIREKNSKILSISLGAERVVGYEGPGVELVNPESEPYIRFAQKYIFPHYTALVSSIDKDFKAKKTHPSSAILHHLAIAKVITGKTSFPDASTVFHIETKVSESAKIKLEALGFSGGKYVVLVPGASDSMKQWGIEKFSEVVREVRKDGLTVVVIGSPSERSLGEFLKRNSGTRIVNAAGAFSLSESAALIKGAYCMVTNDTGPVHIAVALGVPSICIPAGAHLYLNSLYGRKEINRWVYKDIGCLYDDWRCVRSVPPGTPAPCIAAVSAEDIVRELISLKQYLEEHPARNEAFQAGF
jgi:ADP-heptose:LPS heptosyltransferase